MKVPPKQHKPDQMGYYRQSDLLRVDYTPPPGDWMDTKPEFRLGTFIYPAKPKNLRALGMPNPREWAPRDEDWKLPDNWKEIILDAFADRLDKFRSLRVFMDCCVRCGACSDKCHFFIGGGDPKNMPVLRAELLRSVYRREYTLAGKLMARMAGARELTLPVLKEWFYYFYQCTECRRCSLYCPYGIDTAEITMLVRDLLDQVGLNVNWILEPVANCYRTGNHMGIEPHTYVEMADFLCEEIETATGIRPKPSFNRKGAEVLFITPSGDIFGDPGNYTFMGYLLLFHYLEKQGLDITWSTYASEGGNFGSFTSMDLMKRLNAKMYAEAKRLKVKWILGGECGHMWRVIHQYMGTATGPADFLEEPVSPITKTKFENARATKMVHIVEFTADLIKNGKLKLDPSRNDHINLTFHDSCNPARAMGFFEEPRYVIRNVCNNFHEMPPGTIREETFCCGGGAGLGTEEMMEVRLRGGLPRGNAVKYVQEKHGVNRLGCICAIDRATLVTLCNYWAPGVGVTGVHEMVGNALIQDGEKERTTDLRGDDLVKKEAKSDA